MRTIGLADENERVSNGEDSLVQQLYARMKDDIIKGALEPGMGPTERWLCSKYEASRTPIREACSRLARDGLLEWVPNKGYTVSTLSLQDVNELFQLRTILEGAAAELACRSNPAPAQLREAEELSKAIYEAGDLPGYLRFLELNHRFHLLIATMSRNRRLAQELNRVLVHFVRLFYLTVYPDSAGPAMLKEHQAILDAIRQGDAETAREHMVQHIQRSKERAIRYFLG